MYENVYDYSTAREIANANTFSHTIRNMAENANIPLVGFSDLSSEFHRIYSADQSYLTELPNCVTLGTALSSVMMDRVTKQEEDVFAVPNYLYGYQSANQALGDLAFAISAYLEKMGYRALPVAPAQYPDKEKLRGLFSHKIGANLSGLGWIGKSGMLVTEEYGPRVRFASVLTNAPLNVFPGGMMESKCGSCHACVSACPVNAYTNREFSPDEPREARFDAMACYKHHRSLEALGKIDLCGFCVAACPYGKKHLKK